jgi:hypothetical protein
MADEQHAFNAVQDLRCAAECRRIEDKAREGEAELADCEQHLASLDARLDRLETGLAAFRSEVKVRFGVLTWAIGVNAAATIAILGVLLHRP